MIHTILDYLFQLIFFFIMPFYFTFAVFDMYDHKLKEEVTKIIIAHSLVVFYVWYALILVSDKQDADIIFTSCFISVIIFGVVNFLWIACNVLGEIFNYGKLLLKKQE